MQCNFASAKVTPVAEKSPTNHADATNLVCSALPFNRFRPSSCVVMIDVGAFVLRHISNLSPISALSCISFFLSILPCQPQQHNLLFSTGYTQKRIPVTHSQRHDDSIPRRRGGRQVRAQLFFLNGIENSQ